MSQTKPKRQSISPKLRFKVLQRDNFTCKLCGRNNQIGGIELEVDHKIPVSKGGSNHPGNLWTLCRLCNRSKWANPVNLTLELEVFSLVADDSGIKQTTRSQTTKKKLNTTDSTSRAKDSKMRLEELMLKRGFSIQGLARAAKVSPSTVHGLIANTEDSRQTRPGTMKKIADALAVSIEEVDEFDALIKERLGKEAPVTPLIKPTGASLAVA